ncbi:MAG: DUF4258 domain-containing protein [Deltaproteobacteria bacterium]|nr:DUF4258 domain-containing protein [Deltaproteobacteria bacterium]
MADRHLVFRVHAIQRMFQRVISEAEVRQVVMRGETIEDYPDDTPYPSRLVLGWSGPRPLHVVVAENAGACEYIIVTVYEPDTSQWESGFKRRRQ